MNDLETKLHDLLQDRASRPRPAPQAPPGVVRRARRRQVGTALVSAATAVAVIGGAVLGVQAFGRGKPAPNPAAETQGTTRTVSVDGYRVTYPADWALQTVTVAAVGVEPGSPEKPPSSDGTAGGDTAAGAKVPLAESGQWVQLSSLYPDHLLDLSCQGTDVPADGVALQVRAIVQTTGSGSGLEPDTQCPGGARTYSAAQQSGNLDFEAEAMIGPDAPESDVQALFAAYDSIQYPSGDTGVISGGGSSSSSGSVAPDDNQGGAETAPPDGDGSSQSVMTVVAGGTTASGKPWVVLVAPGLTSTQVEVDGLGAGFASAASASGEQPAVPDFVASVMGFSGDDAPAVVGSVVARAARVEIRPDGGAPVELPLSPAPAVTGIDRSYFLSEVPELASKSGTVVALDAEGNVVGRQEVLPPPPNVEPSMPPGPGECVKPQTAADGQAQCPFSGDGSTGQEPASGSSVEPASTASGGSSTESGTVTAAPSPVEATASAAP